MTTAQEERRIWDKKATDAAYQVWNERDQGKWQGAAARCAGYFRSKLAPAWRPDATVLEIGCGIGRLMHRLSALPESPRFLGVDVSEEMLAIARENSKSERETYIYGDGRTLAGIASGSMDAVYSMITFQHIPPEAFYDYLGEMARVLKPGGVFCFQYVEGDKQNYLAHEATRMQVLTWLSYYGLEAQTEKGFMFPNWTWVTGVKLAE